MAALGGYCNLRVQAYERRIVCRSVVSSHAGSECTYSASCQAGQCANVPTMSRSVSSSSSQNTERFAARLAQRTVLEECWKPAFARYLVPKYTGLRRELERYLEYYNFERTHNGRLTKGRTPASVLGAAKMWR